MYKPFFLRTFLMGSLKAVVQIMAALDELSGDIRTAIKSVLNVSENCVNIQQYDSLIGFSYGLNIL